MYNSRDGVVISGFGLAVVFECWPCLHSSCLAHPQVRARNEFDLFSEWSNLLLVNFSSFSSTDHVTTLPPSSPASKSQTSSGFPVYGTVLIVVGVVLVLIVVLFLVFVCLRLNYWLKMQHFHDGVRTIQLLLQYTYIYSILSLFF